MRFAALRLPRVHRPPNIPNRNVAVVGSGAVERAQLPAGVPEHFHPPPALAGGHQACCPR